MGSDVEILDRATPDAVRQVCRTLRAAGHQGWAVGGAVRDALLGRPAEDWDVATSALPEQVIGLFRRTIPTGIQHGTVTVLLGSGEGREAIEVTTFRGEGAYSDARRPDTVTFGVGLDDDLARRDLVVNALAWDPIDHTLHDPFGGLQDLHQRRLRAVGDPAERFREDGLRVMRAVRFAAQLEFALDAATEAAIPSALPSLARVSMERVRDELWKLVGAPRPSLGLVIAQRVGILGVILPELHLPAALPADHEGHLRWARTLARVDAAAGLLVRLGALLVDLADDPDPQPADLAIEALADEPAAAVADRVLRRLKASNAEREAVVRLIRFARSWRRQRFDDGDLRRLLVRVGRAGIPDLLALWTADQAALADGDRRAVHIAALIARARAIVEAGHPLSTGDLAIKGGDVMRVLGIEPGRAVGELLEAALERVLDDPALNTRERLEALVTELRQK